MTKYKLDVNIPVPVVRVEWQDCPHDDNPNEGLAVEVSKNSVYILVQAYGNGTYVRWHKEFWKLKE